MTLASSVKKFVVVAAFALIGLGALSGSASAAADGDLDISTLPPQAQWRINPAYVTQVQVDGVAQINPVGIGLR